MAQNYILLERIELTASAASVTFSNIPQSGYTDLKIVVSSRQDGSVYPNSVDLGIKFNGSSSNFSARYMIGTAGTIYSGTATNLAGLSDPSSWTANTFSNTEIYIPNYLSSNYKSYSVDAVAENNSSTASLGLYGGLWSQTAAINSVSIIDFYNQNLVAGSTFSLYGLAAVGTTPAIAPKALGGNIQTDGTYWYHTFLASGTFTPATNISCDILQIAGGGGGAGPHGGGGGAGGLLALTSQALTTTGYTVTVGAGGASGTANGTSGSNSQVGALTASAGGGGAGGLNQSSPYNGYNGIAGGSGGGGGGSYNNTAGIGGSATQGYAGGNGSSTSVTGAGGGGGGYTAVGSNASGQQGGNGGAGTNAYSSWASATNTGVSSYYAGGGGGGSYVNASSSAATGGSGGGGNGGYTSPSHSTVIASVAGTANTGGGGGGGAGNGGTGSAGGSGLVIIRYAV